MTAHFRDEYSRDGLVYAAALTPSQKFIRVLTRLLRASPPVVVANRNSIAGATLPLVTPAPTDKGAPPTAAP